MNIHEYQAKAILQKYGVPIPDGGLAYSPEQASYRTTEIGNDKWLVKAQVHTGARGKAGAIKLCKTDNEVAQAASQLLGSRIVTPQTGEEGKLCFRLYVEAACDIEREIYLAFALDRTRECITVIYSQQGGMDIEQVAAKMPEAIIRTGVETAVGLLPFQAREISQALGLAKGQIKEMSAILMGCHQAMLDLDASLIEINPLAVTEEGHLLALDAKMEFDDNALFKHSDISELRDKSQESIREKDAQDRGLNYVGLNGNIGCIINGAGLAMATMDMIKHAGGEPANFLDIGGGASPERTAKAFNLVLADASVKVILVNIFAGINRCDWVAEGIISALQKTQTNIPLVVRLSGTNVAEGREIIINSGLPILIADTLAEAATLAVQQLQSSS